MKQVEVYTDGACSGNPGPGGWGAVLRYRFNGKVYEKELSGGDASTTNNRMELTAFIEALRQLKEPCEVRYCSDSHQRAAEGLGQRLEAPRLEEIGRLSCPEPGPLGAGAGAGSKTHHHIRLGQGPRRPSGKRTLRPAGRSPKQSTRREAGNMNDTFLPGSGFDTYESQDKVLMQMDGSTEAAVAVRILQQQGFAVVGAVVRLAPEQAEAAQRAKKTAEALGIECILLNAEALAQQPEAAGAWPQFAALLTAADKLGIQYIGSSSRARLEVGTDGVHTVLPPVDAARDDSTALAALPQETLARLLLPLGEFDAGDLAELAQELQL